MALLTVSIESPLAEAGNSIYVKCISQVRHFCLCVCVLHVPRNASLIQLAQKFGSCPVGDEW